jgi:hypothetical protein
MKMPICPKCQKSIDKLGLIQTEENEFVVRYDKEVEEMEEEIIGDQVGMPYPPKIIKQEYFCPECNATLFTEREDAEKFLASA